MTAISSVQKTPQVPSQPINVARLLRSREIGERAPLKERPVQNIKNGNYLKFTYPGHVSILDVYKHFVATASVHGRVDLWNLKTGDFLWSFTFDPIVRCEGLIKIVAGKIVCSGIKEGLDGFTPTIRILDFQTNDQTAINHPGLSPRFKQICVIRNEIFAALGSQIQAWNLNGQPTRTIRSEALSGGEGDFNFLGLGDFLVHTSGNTALIHDLKNKPMFKVVMDVPGEDRMTISSAHIDGDFLICGVSRHFQSLQTSVSDFFIMDLVTKGVVLSHRLNSEPLPEDLFQHAKRGAIKKVIKKGDSVYLGYSNGFVSVVKLPLNQGDKTQEFALGKHSNEISELSLEENVLVSASETGESAEGLISSQIKFWDLRSMTKLAEITQASLSNARFVSGMLIANDELSLVLRDYNILGKGEKVTQNSLHNFAFATLLAPASGTPLLEPYPQE